MDDKISAMVEQFELPFTTAEYEILSTKLLHNRIDQLNIQF